MTQDLESPHENADATARRRAEERLRSVAESGVIAIAVFDPGGAIIEANDEFLSIVAITGWGQDDDRRKTREAGFDAHLVKPVEPPRLIETLGQLTLSQQT